MVLSQFGLQGGAVVHIFDSIIKNNIDTYFYIMKECCTSNRIKCKMYRKYWCAVITTGPGTTNAITGLLAAWQDSFL